MNIKTKYSIGDLVYYQDCDEDKPWKCRVMSVSTWTVKLEDGKLHTCIYYELCHVYDNGEEKWLLSKYFEDKLKPIK